MARLSRRLTHGRRAEPLGSANKIPSRVMRVGSTVCCACGQCQHFCSDSRISRTRRLSAGADAFRTVREWERSIWARLEFIPRRRYSPDQGFLIAMTSIPTRSSCLAATTSCADAARRQLRRDSNNGWANDLCAAEVKSVRSPDIIRRLLTLESVT